MSRKSASATIRDLSWRRCGEAVALFLRGATATAAWPTALVVGTILSAVNQGDLIVTGAATLGTWLRVAFNYAVPFVVASIGFLSAHRVRDDASRS